MTTTDHRSTLCRVYAVLIELAEKRQEEEKKPVHISKVLARLNPCDCPDGHTLNQEVTTTNEHDRR